ncbi:MAG: ATP-binding protein [Actinobacteria bacterium]|nr:ATP-binding protein [Actinomycetota bacterium]MCA1720087.1 ATP-binding protein [Actinomycetota bacterium]
MSTSLDLPPAAASVRDARHFVVGLLEEWGLDDLVETAALLTSELVTNSVLHARTSIRVAVERRDTGVAVAVSDGSGVSPRRRRHSQTATTGRGLDLLEKLADSWEVVPEEGGKTLRFVLTSGADPWAAFAADGAWADAQL